MRQIGSINSDQDAERFSDYLLTQGIGNMVEEGGPGGAWAVWVENDDHLDRGRAELEQFRANPSDPRYEAAGRAERLRKQAEKAEHRRRKQFVDVRTRWGQPSQLARPVTMALAALCVLAAVGTKLNMAGPTPLKNMLMIAPVDERADGWVEWDGLEAIRHGQVWRLLTPIFLHFGPLHLLFNLFVLFDLASMIEQRRGSLFLLALVLVTAVASNLAEYYASFSLTDASLRPSPLFGGMSGVNYALFGYAWMKGKYQPHLGIAVAQQTVTVMLVWLVLCIAVPGMNVANVAHLGGLAAGVAIGYLPYAVRRVIRRRRS
jgi:GlpG protein